jgi:hypothetical protein
MDPYELLNQAISVIPGMSSPRYPGGGRINTSVGQTGAPPPGQLAYKDGKPVFYVDPYYGFQSAESFKKATGKYPQGFEPAAPLASAAPPSPASPEPDMGSQGASSTEPPATGGGAPDTAPPAPTPGSVGEGAGVEQEQEPIVDPTRELIERVFDPEYQREISQQKLRNLIEASIVTSALKAPRERQKQQAETERQNIQAWRDIRTAQIEANARQQMALGLATVSALTPNMQNFAEIYKASQAPFNLRSARG